MTARVSPPRQLRIGSLFSGIGGLELGLERAGLGHAVWQVEKDPFCRAVLAKHWPHVERFEDVCTVGRVALAPVDLLCGGFPCQDVSSAGKRQGLDGAKSGLWREFRRIVEELRPWLVVVENVTSGKKLWLPTVRADLEAMGYRTRAFALSAEDVGAPHLRRRVFVVATSDANGLVLREQSGRGERENREGPALSLVAGEARGADGHAHGDGESALPVDGKVAGVPSVASGASAWAAPPVFRRVDDGVPGPLDGADCLGPLEVLGNAVVPQCAEVVGRMIAEYLEHARAA
jgi:DNA (cytosine-5)-methyltransferase 1